MQELILTYDRVNRYCNYLEHHGLIKYDPANRTYSLKPKGEDVLKLSEELAEYLLPIDQMIKKYSFYIQNQYSPEYRSDNKNAGKLAIQQDVY